MNPGNYSMMGSVAALVAQTLRTYDCDPEPLFREAGLDMGLLPGWPVTHCETPLPA
jgi:hypothetical protein